MATSESVAAFIAPLVSGEADTSRDESETYDPVVVRLLQTNRHRSMAMRCVTPTEAALKFTLSTPATSLPST